MEVFIEEDLSGKEDLKQKGPLSRPSKVRDQRDLTSKEERKHSTPAEKDSAKEEG